MLKKQTILIISPEPWGINFISKHHYAVELSRRGNKVFFLNPPKSDHNLNHNPIEGHSNLFEINYSQPKGLNRLPQFIANLIHKKIIQDLMRITGKIDIVWSFDPFRFQNLKLFNSEKAIYHPVDIHNTKLEKITSKNADIIFSTAQKILDRLDQNIPKQVINHGLAEHFIEIYKEKNSNYFKLPKKEDFPIKVGYVGNLNYQFLDKEVLEKIIDQNSTIGFYFFDDVTLVTQANDEFIETMCLINFHDMPKNWLTANLNHWLGFEMGLL